MAHRRDMTFEVLTRIQSDLGSIAPAAVIGMDVLLGAIPMHDLDVIVDRKLEQLRVPPKRSNFAPSTVK